MAKDKFDYYGSFRTFLLRLISNDAPMHEPASGILISYA